MSRKAKTRMSRVLALSLILMLLLSVVQTPFAGAWASAQAEHPLELTLTQTEPEQGFVMIPGVPLAQDITVNLGKSSGSSYVFVRLTERNNEASYLTYEMAEGWSPLLMPGGEAVSGVYYRLHESAAPASWPVLAGQQLIVNPETVTKSVLETLAADPTGETWPHLTYNAYGFALEEADGVVSPYDAWTVIHGDSWQIRSEQKDPQPELVSALQPAEGLVLSAFDVSLQDETGLQMQPRSTLQVRLPVAEGATDAIVLHELTGHSNIAAAIRSGTAFSFAGAEGSVFEAVPAAVEEGYAVFDAASFSPYYVVSGHSETLENWWKGTQTTRYNFDSEIYGLDPDGSGAREFVVEPNSTFYIFLKGTKLEQGVTYDTPVEGTWAVTSDNTEGRIMMTTAGDGLGKVISVSADATTDDMLKVTANGWTITIRVKENVVADAYNNSNYPVYIGITLDAYTITVGKEPRVSGYDTNNWVYVTDMSDGITFSSKSGGVQYNEIEPIPGSKGADYINESIKTAPMLEGRDDKSVTGIIDHTLDTVANGAINIAPYVRNIDWNAIAEALLADSNISSKLLATDNGGVNSNPSAYVLKPYVVKLQTNEYVGWHINACFEPINTSNEWIYFDDNLDEDAGERVEFLNVPARQPWKDGAGMPISPFYVVPGYNSDYTRISVSEYVTLTNGQKMRFMGWNTTPDGDGDLYNRQGGSFNKPNVTTNKKPLVPGGTLYAFWDSPLDRLEIHKDLIIDGEDNRTMKPDFTFTVTLEIPSTMQVETGVKIIGEVFNKADNSLDSKTEVLIQNGVNSYVLKLEFNEDQYGVIYAPKGMTYSIEESFQAGNTEYSLINKQNTTGTIEGVGEGSVARFTNGWNNTTGVLHVEKNVVLEEGQSVENWNTMEFDINVALTAPESEPAPETYTYQFFDSLGNTVGDPVAAAQPEGGFTFSLAHDEYVEFTRVPQNTTYTVTETLHADSPFTPENGGVITGKIEAQKTSDAVIVNRIVETNGTITITKAFDGCTPEDGESFIFSVKDADNVEVAEVVIYGAGSKTVSVPYGDYTVTEENAWSWRYADAQSKLVTVSSAVPNPEVTFTNTMLNNKWLDGSAGAHNNFANKTVAKYFRGDEPK